VIGILLRIVIIVLIAGAIYLGIRRIWRDWTKQFPGRGGGHPQARPQGARPARCHHPQARKDGTFRPPENDNR